MIIPNMGRTGPILLPTICFLMMAVPTTCVSGEKDAYADIVQILKRELFSATNMHVLRFTGFSGIGVDNIDAAEFDVHVDDKRYCLKLGEEKGGFKAEKFEHFLVDIEEEGKTKTYDASLLTLTHFGQVIPVRTGQEVYYWPHMLRSDALFLYVNWVNIDDGKFRRIITKLDHPNTKDANKAGTGASGHLPIVVTNRPASTANAPPSKPDK